MGAGERHAAPVCGGSTRPLTVDGTRRSDARRQSATGTLSAQRLAFAGTYRIPSPIGRMGPRFPSHMTLRHVRIL